MYLQLVGTAMGTIFAPPYSCLTIGFLEVTKLYPALRSTFSTSAATYVEENYKRYMDDGITPLPPEISAEDFLSILLSLDRDIKFTLEEAEQVRGPNGIIYQRLSHLDVLIILHSSGVVETDVYYKSTNNHDYLSYKSHHPQHVIDNIPYNLAKRIIVFCSDSDTMEFRLTELRKWLLKCDYPAKLIDNKFRNARLQGPAPEPENKDIITFVSTNYSNYDITNISHTSKSLLSNTRNSRINEVFNDCKIVTAYKQPPNLLRQLSRSRFSSANSVYERLAPGLFKCENKRCELCRDGYIQECNSFLTANGKEWEIRSHITCNSTNVIYYLVCNFCRTETYCGKTNCLRKRLNNHKSSSLSGKSSDIFDNHVFDCLNKSTQILKPLFLTYAFMRLKNEEQLLSYESHLHAKAVDTMNSPQI